MASSRMARRLLAVAALAVSVPALAAPQADQGVEKAIRGSIDSFIAAFNKQDAAALGAHWVDEGAVVDTLTGERIAGRPALVAHYKSIFAGGKKPVLAVNIESIRSLGPDVAIEEGLARVTNGKQAQAARYVAIHLKRDGGWKLESIRETPVLSSTAATSSPLEELAWLVGDWVEADKSASIKTSCRWSLGRAFLIRSFQISRGADRVFEGTEVIGWDPAARQIRSWTFDAGGGFQEGSWRRADGGWVVKIKGVLPDGARMTATHLLTKVDDATIRWESVGREIDGGLLPNVGPAIIKRRDVALNNGSKQ